MHMAISSNDLFDQNAGKVGKQVRLRYIYINISGIDLFDQNAGMICANVRLRCLHIINIQFSYTFFQISALNSAP